MVWSKQLRVLSVVLLVGVGLVGCVDGDDASESSTSAPSSSESSTSTPSSSASSSTANCEAEIGGLWPGTDEFMPVQVSESVSSVADLGGLQEALETFGVAVDPGAAVTWDQAMCRATLPDADGLDVQFGITDDGAVVIQNLSVGATIEGGWMGSGDRLEFGPPLEQCGAECIVETSVRFGDVEATTSGNPAAPIVVMVENRPMDIEGRFIRRVTDGGELVALSATSLPAGDFAAG